MTVTLPTPSNAALERRFLLIVMSGFLAVAMAFVSLWLAVTSAKRTPIPVRQNRHSWLRHGEIADYMHNACQENGPEEIWKFRQEERFIQICKLPDGRFGIQIFQKVKDVWEEITSFVPEKTGQNSLQIVRDYLEAHNATPFKGPLP